MIIMPYCGIFSKLNHGLFRTVGTVCTLVDCQDSFRQSIQLQTVKATADIGRLSVKATADSCRLSRQLKTVEDHGKHVGS